MQFFCVTNKHWVSLICYCKAPYCGTNQNTIQHQSDYIFRYSYVSKYCYEKCSI